MKALYSFIISLTLALNVNAQWYTVTHPSGTVLYGTTNVTVTSGGTATIYGTWCGAGPYWIGDGTGTVATPGWFTYTFSPAVTSFRVWITAADPGESIALSVNGVHYSITSGEVTGWTGGCFTSTMSLSGDSLLSTSYNASSEVNVTYCPITSVTVETDGVENGSVFTFMFSDSGSCFTALNNGPCYGDSLKFRTQGDSVGATYFWTGPGGFTSTLQNPFIFPAVYSDTGVYTVVRFLGLGTDTSSTHVTVHYKPVLVVTSNAPLCVGLVDTLHLSVIPDSTSWLYSWTGPSGFTSTLEYPQINGFLPTDVGTYTVIAVTAYGCKDTGTTNVILAPVPPAPAITGDTVYCSGNAFVPFTVIGTGTILWYTTGTGGTGTTTPPVVNTSFGGTYTFWASQTILGCESKRDSITVTVHVTPAPPAITGATVFCQYLPYTSPTVTGTNVLWYMAAAGGIGSATAPMVNTDIAGNSYFWVSQSDSGCESPRAPITIIVNPKPVPPVIIDVPDNYCPGQAFVPFTVVSGINILWYAAPTGGVSSGVSPTINTVNPGSFSVWATQTVLGCESDREQVIVTVYDSVKAGFNYAIDFGCKGDTVVFTNTSTGTSIYSWVFGDGYNSIDANPSHIYLLQGYYNVTMYASSATCIDSFKQTIDLDYPLHAAFDATPVILCQGSSVTFIDASTAVSGHHSWFYGNGSNDTGATRVYTYKNTGVYNAFEVVTDSVNCKDTAYQVIQVDSASAIHMAITDTSLCRGTYVTFTGNYSDIGNLGITWNFGNGDSIRNTNPVKYAYDNTGTFTVTATAWYRACEDASVSRVLTILPQPSIYLGQDTAICKGGAAIQLLDKNNYATPGATWKWNTGQTTAGITVTEPGTYTAQVRINGCTASSTVNVGNDCYMNIPNVFTPNGDGLNDYFYPRQLLSSGLISFTMNIYNRWGQLVFQTESLDGRGWDGKLNGADQPEGVYVYIIDGTFKDGQTEHHQGNITLLR